MKRILAIISFYLINFGLWELLVGYIGREWDSFLVYVILFPLIIFINRKELKSELKDFSSILKSKSFYIELIIWLVLDLLFTGLLLLGINNFGWDILPQNNNSVKDQMAVVPLFLTSFYMKKKNPFASIVLHSAVNIVGYISLIAGVL